MANKAIKYRVYPTQNQKILFEKTFGCCRKIYNLMLADKIAGYEKTGKNPSVNPAEYKKDYPYLREVDSLALTGKWIDLNSAFSKFYDGKGGFPKFKSKKHTRKSYRTNNQNGTVAIVGDAIKLPKVGMVKAVIHRKPKDDWKLKSATVSRDPDGKYYISVLFEFEHTCNYVADMTNAIGLDYASNGLYVDNNGNIGSNHKFFRESQKKLAKEQRKLSRKQGANKGEEKSKNYLKQEKKVNKIYRHIANQRKDNLHKLSTEIANQYDVVCVENLNMKSLANRGFRNGKATMDNGYGIFLEMLAYKLGDRNKYLIKVDKWFPSSQLCSECGYKNPEVKDVKIRRWKCPVCHTIHDRDRNAAINILNEGLRILKGSA